MKPVKDTIAKLEKEGWQVGEPTVQKYQGMEITRISLKHPKDAHWGTATTIGDDKAGWSKIDLAFNTGPSKNPGINYRGDFNY